MSEAPQDDQQHRRPHPPPMAAPFLEFHLAKEMEQLNDEPDWSRGQNARTLVKFDDLRVVLTALKAGARLPEHQTRGRVCIHVVSGHVVARAEGRTFDMPVGSLLAFDQNVPHDVEALEDSAFLITVALRQTQGDSPPGVSERQ